MEFDQAIDQMKDVTALLTARMHDDLEAGRAVTTEENTLGLLFGMTDLTLAIIRLVCAISGNSVEEFVQSIGKVTARLENEGSK